MNTELEAVLIHRKDDNMEILVRPRVGADITLKCTNRELHKIVEHLSVVDGKLLLSGTIRRG